MHNLILNYFERNTRSIMNAVSQPHCDSFPTLKLYNSRVGRHDFGGLIFGGAYTWRGLFSEFYGIT